MSFEKSKNSFISILSLILLASLKACVCEYVGYNADTMLLNVLSLLFLG